MNLQNEQRDKTAGTPPCNAVFISAGDMSGDAHAANLMNELRVRAPGVSFAGFGLEKMLAAGLVSMDAEPPPGGAMWLHNLTGAGRFRRRLAAAKKFLNETPPGLAILVDYGGFNLYLAHAASKAGVPVLYYILPQVWAHGRYRLKKLRKWVTRAAAVYPFEPEICRRYGLDAQYVGHPVFDELSLNPPQRQRVIEIEEQYGSSRLAALFPGSRRQEIKANLPVILDACRLIQDEEPGVRFAAACPGSVREPASAIIEKSGINVSLCDARPVELAGAAELCITKPGTVTLEIASQHTPMVIMYRTNFFLYFLMSGMAHTPHAGIINALAGKTVCPEKVMWRSEPGWICRRALELLRDEGLRRRHSEALKSAVNALGGPGASARTAGIAVELMNRR